MVAGDFNSFKHDHVETIAQEARALGLEPVLPSGVKTFSFAGVTIPVQLDHIFVRSLTCEASNRGPRRCSDHFPVWADLRFAPAEREPGPPGEPSAGNDPPLVCPEPIQ